MRGKRCTITIMTGVGLGGYAVPEQLYYETLLMAFYHKIQSTNVTIV